jgi:hypothetical protein
MLVKPPVLGRHLVPSLTENQNEIIQVALLSLKRVGVPTRQLTLRVAELPTDQLKFLPENFDLLSLPGKPGSRRSGAA